MSRVTRSGQRLTLMLASRLARANGQNIRLQNMCRLVVMDLCWLALRPKWQMGWRHGLKRRMLMDSIWPMLFFLDRSRMLFTISCPSCRRGAFSGKIMWCRVGRIGIASIRKRGRLVRWMSMLPRSIDGKLLLVEKSITFRNDDWDRFST
jgi:hypothetical protein